MNYRSFADLADVIRRNLHKIPSDVDLIVGIPRSGLLVANMMALLLNTHLTDVNGLIENRPLKCGQTRTCRNSDLEKPQDAAHTLIVDDSAYSGSSLRTVKEAVSRTAVADRVSYCVVYAHRQSRQFVDFYLELLPSPRIFEWNAMHDPVVADWCLEIDGVLCVGPTPEQLEDNDAYTEFLLSAAPLARPSYPVGHLVTSRPEKYRHQTEIWLRSYGVRYRQLHMPHLPDNPVPRRLANHAAFKADVYKRVKDAMLFVENDPRQASDIAQISGKPVLCFSAQKLFKPGLSIPLIEDKARSFNRRVRARLGRFAGRVLDV